MRSKSFYQVYTDSKKIWLFYFYYAYNTKCAVVKRVEWSSMESLKSMAPLSKCIFSVKSVWSFSLVIILIASHWKFICFLHPLCFLYLFLQNNTMKILFMYHNLKPQRGSITPGSLPSPSEAFKHVIPVFLTQRSINSSTLRNQKHLEFIDLKNEDAQLPYLDETVHWCKMFKLSQFSKKNHIVRVCFVCVLLLFIIVAKL